MKFAIWFKAGAFLLNAAVYVAFGEISNAIAALFSAGVALLLIDMEYPA